MQDPDRIWHLIAKKLAGEASAAELKELEQLLQQNPGASFPMEQLTQLWSREIPHDAAAAEEAFDKHLDRLAQKRAALTYEKQKTEQATWTDRRKKTWLLHTFFNSNGLVNHYFRLIWRGLMRSKSFSFINITGLAVGMASAILIILWIQHELSMDRFHSKVDRTFQMLTRAKFGEEVDVWGSTPHQLAPALKTGFPQQVEDAVRTSWVAAFVLKNAGKVIQTEGLLTDSGFLQVFDFPLRKGDARTALTKPHSILLTERLVKQLFDDGDAMGKTIEIDSNAIFTVTGILKDLPNNTQFTFDYLVPWSYMKEIKWENLDWRANTTLTYVLLKPGVTEQKGNELFKNVRNDHVKGEISDLLLHPVGKLWLWSHYDNGKLAGGRIETVRLFSIIAAFILLIACINYMNLSTARSDKRSKEVGISKVVGARRGSLIARFMGESILVSFFPVSSHCCWCMSVSRFLIS